MVLAGEQRVEPGLLLGGEQIGAGVQGASGPIQRVVFAAAVTVQPLLDPASAAVQRLAR